MFSKQCSLRMSRASLRSNHASPFRRNFFMTLLNNTSLPTNQPIPLHMLKSRSCLWQRIQASDFSITNPRSLNHLDHPFRQPSLYRLLSTSHVLHSLAARPRAPLEVDKLARAGKDPWTQSAVAANQKRRERAALRQPQPRRDAAAATLPEWNFGKRDPSMSDSDWDRRKRELQHLRDPLELAKFVKQELRKNKAEEMSQLVRMASHSMQCVVSWNHIIDHLLTKEEINQALKMYNEVRLASPAMRRNMLIEV